MLTSILDMRGIINNFEIAKEFNGYTNQDMMIPTAQEDVEFVEAIERDTDG